MTEPTIELTNPNKSQSTDAIRDMRLQILELSETINELTEYTRDKEENETLYIENKWENEKDKALSNASKRAIAIRDNLNSILEYVEANQEIDKLKKAKARMEIELDFMLRADRKERLKTDISFVEALSMLLKKV